MNRDLYPIDSEHLASSLNARGYAQIPGVLSPEQCRELILLYDAPQHFRSTVDMQRYRFGAGQYKYFHYPLPSLITSLRTAFYAALLETANLWMSQLGLEIRYPPGHREFIESCHVNQQKRATPLILRYEACGYNTMHQDLYGKVFFPFQIVIPLNQAGTDYEGGEFVMIQQIPRAQSRAIVLQPDCGDAVIFTTNFRPVKGSKGYYRTTMKHGVSEVRNGIRYSLGIILHDAA